MAWVWRQLCSRPVRALLVGLGLLALANTLLESRVPAASPLPLPLRRGMPHAPAHRANLPGVVLTRSGQPVLEAPARGTLRVLVLGGSSAYGYGMTRFRSYPALLQARLDQAGRPVEVVNGAFAAMDLIDGLEDLRTDLSRLHPDLVVCALGTNEMLRLRLYSTENPNWSPRIEALRQHLEGLALYRFLASRREAPPSPGPPAAPQFPTPLGEAHKDLVRPVLERTLGEMVALCRGAGVPLVLVTDPCHELWPPYVDPKWKPGDARLGAWEAYQAGVGLLQTGRKAEALDRLEQAVERDPRPFRCLPSFRALIREVASRSGVPVLDSQEGIRLRSPSGVADDHLFYDNCHLVPPGNQAMAGLLLAFLDQQGLLPPAAPGPKPPPPDPADLEGLDLMDEARVLPPVPDNLLTPAPDWTSPRFPWTHYQYQRHLASEGTVEGQVSRGHLAFSSQDYPEAVRWYREALRREPERAVLWRNLGHALLAARQESGALEAYRRFLRLGGRDPRLARLVQSLEGAAARPAAALQDPGRRA